MSGGQFSVRGNPDEHDKPQFNSAAAAPAIGGDPCILFPAGIRPVKRPLLPLSPLERLQRQRPLLRLWYAGPALDPGEMRRLDEALRPRPWAPFA